jgi:hypothetical protein
MAVSEATVALTAFFGRAAEASRETVSLHTPGRSDDDRFARNALAAVAILDECSTARQADPADLWLVRDLARDAAAVCRTEDPTDGLVAVAALFEEVARSCDPLLGDAAGSESGWQRFLFADAEVRVRRGTRRWHARSATGEAEGTFLDAALGRLPLAASDRIHELTVQILAWFAELESADAEASAAA